MNIKDKFERLDNCFIDHLEMVMKVQEKKRDVRAISGFVCYLRDIDGTVNNPDPSVSNMLSGTTTFVDEKIGELKSRLRNLNEKDPDEYVKNMIAAKECILLDLNRIQGEINTISNEFRFNRKKEEKNYEL